jgi:type I restriction enzyme R subunit
MTHQSESQLEKTLINQLQRLGFSPIVLKDQDAIIANLRTQLEKFNQIKFSDVEFAQILNHLNKGDRFAKAKTLRDYFLLKRDDETTKHIRFFNMDQNTKSPNKSPKSDDMKIAMM